MADIPVVTGTAVVMGPAPSAPPESPPPTYAPMQPQQGEVIGVSGVPVAVDSGVSLEVSKRADASSASRSRSLPWQREICRAAGDGR